MGKQQVHSAETIPPSDFLDTIGGHLKDANTDRGVSDREDTAQLTKGFQDEVDDDELLLSTEGHDNHAEDAQLDDYVADVLVGLEINDCIGGANEEIGFE